MNPFYILSMFFVALGIVCLPIGVGLGMAQYKEHIRKEMLQKTEDLFYEAMPTIQFDTDGECFVEYLDPGRYRVVTRK